MREKSSFSPLFSPKRRKKRVASLVYSHSKSGGDEALLSFILIQKEKEKSIESIPCM